MLQIGITSAPMPTRSSNDQAAPRPADALGNIRELGVQNLIASCLNDACRHTALIDVSNYPAETEVPSSARAWSAPSAAAGATRSAFAAGETIRECAVVPAGSIRSPIKAVPKSLSRIADFRFLALRIEFGCLMKPVRHELCRGVQCLSNWAASVSDTALTTWLVWGLSSRSRRLTLMMSVAFRSAK